MSKIVQVTEEVKTEEVVESTKPVIDNEEIEKLKQENEELKNKLNDDSLVKMTKEEFDDYKKKWNEEDKKRRLQVKDVTSTNENLTKENESLKLQIEELRKEYFKGLSEEDAEIAKDIPTLKALKLFIQRLNKSNSQGVPERKTEIDNVKRLNIIQTRR
jgi:cell division protein FtsB